MPSKIPHGETRGWIVPIGGAENKENDRDILFLNYGRSLSDRRFWMVGLSLQVMLHKL